jgi:hypothetical protein
MGRGGNLIYGEITPETNQTRGKAIYNTDDGESFFENKEKAAVLEKIDSANKEFGIIINKPIYNYLIEKLNDLGITDERKIKKIEFDNYGAQALRIELEKQKVSIKDAENFIYQLAILSDAARLNTWAATKANIYNSDKQAIEAFDSWDENEQTSTVPRRRVYTYDQWQEVIEAAKIAADPDLQRNGERPGILKEALEAAKDKKRETLAERLYGNAFMKAIGDQRGLETISAYCNLSESEKDRYRELADQELESN